MADDSEPPVDRLKRLWSQCKAHEDQMQSCVTDIIAHNESLQRQLAETESELMDKKDAIRTLRLDLQEIRRNAPDLTNRTSANDQIGDDCVLVLIVDSDYLRFRQDLVDQGRTGGKNAASMLRDAIKEEMKSTMSPSANPMSLLIRIFGSTTYKSVGKGYTDHAVFLEFVRGFNASAEECYYVGMGGDAAKKVRDTFRGFLAYDRCKKIFFGGASAQYMHLLNEATQDKISKVTLISGLQLPRALSNVANNHGLVQVEALFDTVLQHSAESRKRKASCDLAQPAGPPQPAAGPAQPAAGPAQPAAGPPQPADHPRPHFTLAQPFGSAPPREMAEPPVIAPRNLFGSAAPGTRSGIFGSLSPAKASTLTTSTQQGSSQPGPFKNPFQSFLPPNTYKELVAGGYYVTYHILGTCDLPWGPFSSGITCKGIHGPRLDTTDIEKVASEARQLRCMKGLICNFKYCVFGHAHLWGGESKGGIQPGGT